MILRSCGNFWVCSIGLGLGFSLLYSGTYERMPKQPTNKGFSYLWLWFFKLSILSNVIWRSKYILIKIFKALYTCIFFTTPSRIYEHALLRIKDTSAFTNQHMVEYCKILRRSFCQIGMNSHFKLTLFGAFNLTIGFNMPHEAEADVSDLPHIHHRFTKDILNYICFYVSKVNLWQTEDRYLRCCF